MNNGQYKEMTMKKVSIIVPVYNAEKYLNKCIDSILQQSYSNYELLLIDDGSTDKSYNICKAYELKNDKVICLKEENGGAGRARNYGIEQSTGDYIMFVDSDDYIARDCLKVLMELVEEGDIAVISQVTEGDVDIFLSKEVKREKEIVLSGKEALQGMCLRDKIGAAPWGKVYDKKLFKNIRFPNGKLYEDIWTIPYLLDKADKVIFENVGLYYYVQRPESLMHRKIKSKDYEDFEGLDKLVSYIDIKYPELHDIAMCRWINDFFGTLVNRMVFQKDYYKESLRLRNKYCMKFKEDIKNKYIDRIKRIQVILFIYNLPMLRVLMKVYIKMFKKY